VRLRTVLIIGAAVRLLLAPFFAHPFDVFAWYTNAESLIGGAKPVQSFVSPYYYSFFFFVFPAGLAFEFLSRFTGTLTVSVSSLNPILIPSVPHTITIIPGILFDFLVKLPLILSDALICVLLHRIMVKNGGERMAIKVASIWFLNPLVIWVSSGWGTFDTLPTLFTLLSFYLVQDRKFAVSGLTLAVAAALKVYAVVLAFPILVLAWSRGGRLGLLKTGAIFSLSLALLLFPLLLPYRPAFALFSQPSSVQGLRYSGLSIWTSLTLFVPSQYQLLASGLLISLGLLLVYYWAVKKLSEGLVGPSISLGLSIVVLLLVYTFVGENFFVWLIPFAAIVAAGDRTSRRLLWALSILALVSSVTDSLLPYYMLPLAPWIGPTLVNILTGLAPVRVAPSGAVVQGLTAGKLVLAGFGLAAAALLLLLAWRWHSPERVGLEQAKLDSK
jgi:hypothetical protein